MLEESMRSPLRPHRVRGVLAAALVLSWAAAARPEAEPQESPSRNVQDLASREAELGPPRELVDPAGSFRAEALVPFSSRRDEVNGLFVVTLDIGAEDAIRCYFFEEELNVANALLSLGKGQLEMFRDGAPIARQRIAGTGAGSLEGIPYLEAHWLFQQGSGGVGHSKLAGATVQGHSILCETAAFGFQQTFQRVFRGIVTSYQRKTPPASPYFAELLVTSLGNLDVGYQWLRMRRDETGDTRIEISSALLVPASDSELRGIDSIVVEWSTPDGRLINMLSEQTEQGGAVTSLSLRPADATTWNVTGRFQSEEIEASLEAPGPLQSTLGEYLDLTRRLQPKGPEPKVGGLRWVSDANPRGFVDSEYRLLETLPDGRSRVGVSMGPMAFEGIRGTHGTLESARIPAGGGTLELRLVHREGEL